MPNKILTSNEAILIPQIQYNTNDSWEMISGMDGGFGWPLLHQASFGNGKLYLLTIPENFADLYNLPSPVLNAIRETISKPLGIELKGVSKVSLFLYDNNTLVVESFNDQPVEVELLLPEQAGQVIDLFTDERLEMKVVPEIRRRNGRVSTPE